MNQKLFIGLAALFILAGLVTAAPHLGDSYWFKQPDGSKVEVKIWGDEFYQRAETPEGYTLVRDTSGWICYAHLSADGTTLVPTVKRHTSQPIGASFFVISNTSGQQVTVQKGIDINPASRRAKAKEKQQQWHPSLSGIAYSGSSSAVAASSLYSVAPAPLLGDVKGLTVCVQFPDETGVLTVEQVDNYCNLQGYSEFSNNGSVFDYYYSVSGGKLSYTNIVMGYYTAKNNKSYYDDPSRDAGDAGRELIAEVFAWLVEQNFDFTQLSVNDNNTMLAINLFYAGEPEAGWSLGLWPHSGYYADFTSSTGIKSGRYQITNTGTQLELGTFCHENGHMICLWPDLYDYGYESTGVGQYCLMAYGGSGGNPLPPNAYFRDIKGWEEVTLLSTIAVQEYTTTSNANASYKYPNPANAEESFYIESRLRTGRNTSLPDDGLVIWHVDESGDNDYEQMTPSLHYLVSLEQADGQFDLEAGNNYGDSTDLFTKDYGSEFNDQTVPDAKWWDGTDSKLKIIILTNAGTTMRFAPEIIDNTAPTPDPVLWKTTPTAVGLNTIYMEVDTATDSAGVEYFFDCIHDNAYDSGWQDSRIYYRGGYAEATTYTFQVKARDKSEYKNETQWSVAWEATTASETDTLPPLPDPARWKGTPRRVPATGTRVAMEGMGYDEYGSTVKYYFDCIYSDDPAYPNQDVLGSSLDSSSNYNNPATWQTNSLYTRSGLTIANPGYQYIFRYQVMDAAGNKTGWSNEEGVLTSPSANIRTVPYPYQNIQDAIDACNPASGDIVVVNAGEGSGPGGAYVGLRNRNLNFDIPVSKLGSLPVSAMNITVRGSIPSSPASTVIDCQGQDRAFVFRNGEGRDIIIEGFTVRNGTSSVATAVDAFGGAILGGAVDANGQIVASSKAASPTIRKCVFNNCTASGQDGQDGLPDSGANGGNGGNGFGGAMYFVTGSNPLIDQCQFTLCTATGGDGGDGGSGAGIDTTTDPVTPPVNGGNGGNAGIAAGGAMYFAPGCLPVLENITVSNCSAVIGQIGSGGNGGIGDDENAGANGGNAGDLGGTYTHAGALYFGAGSTVTINNSTISNCTVFALQGGFGGGQGGEGTPVGNPGVITTPNLALLVSYGGANYYGANCTATLTNTTFESNTATLNKGGAEYYASRCNATYTNCTYRQNSSPRVLPPYNSVGAAGLGGGSIYLVDPVLADFINCTISQNTAYLGAGVYFEGQTTAAVAFTGSTFGQNDSSVNNQSSFGGAIYAGNVATASLVAAGTVANPPYSLTVTDCTFETNISSYGGGICADGVKLDITGSTFLSNTAQYGGGVFSYGGSVVTEDTVFRGNAAEVTLSANGAVSGAAAYLLRSNVELSHTIFMLNTSEGNAGAVSLSGMPLPNSPRHAFTNCLFIHNTAEVDAGALDVEYNAEPAISNCTFANNDAQTGLGGGILCYDAFVDVIDSIFWDNTAVYGSQIELGDPFELDSNYIPLSTVFADYSDIQGGKESGIYIADDWQWLWYGANNIDTDPLFVTLNVTSVSTENYYLSQIAAGQTETSPCVDTGSTTAAAAGLDTYTTRTDHVADSNDVDMGYHYVATLPVAEYILETNVYVDYLLPHGTLEVTTEPNDPFRVVDAATSHYLYRFKQGTVVQLLAKADPYYRVRRWTGTDNDALVGPVNQVAMVSNKYVTVEFELAVPKNLYVPESYDTIEDALLAARDGDRVVLAPRPDAPYLIENPDGLDFGGKNLVVMSIDPDDPLIVAQTIIDCQGSRYVSKRAFHFAGGETDKSVIEGITIRNAFTAVIGASEAISTGRWPWWEGFDPTSWNESPPDPLPPLRALSGADATGDSYGGAILCESGSSPLIRNCVFENCTVSGGVGGDGQDGQWPADMQDVTEDLDSQSGGHSGKGTGNGYGGAIAIRSGSNPKILNCTFKNNRATGGWGGIPGNAGRSYNNGRFGWGGNDYDGLAYALAAGINPQAGYGEGDGFGGAVYVDQSCRPTILDCTFISNSARPGFVYDGGTEGDGGAYPDPYDDDPWAEDGMRDGRPGYIISEGLSSGGAVFFEEDADAELLGCVFKENMASTAYTYNDTPVGTRGGAIFVSENATVRILPGSDDRRSVFSGNISGALYCSTQSVVTVESAEFALNTSTLPVDIYTMLSPEYAIAGGITIEPDALAAATLKDCQFQDNVSTFGGAAVRTLSSINMSDCVFSGNQSQSDGGAIYSFVHLPSPATQTLWMNIDNCEFSGNASQGLGGAMFVKNVILTMNDSFLVMNTAFSGGGIRMTYGEITMTGCMVYGNEATGAIAGAHRTVTDEGFGGGLHIVDSQLALADTRFEKNIARGIISTGGGLCITGGQVYYQQNVKNCLFADNISDNAGGGASVLLYAKTGFSYCTFANNTAGGSQGGGLYVDQYSSVMFDNSIVSGNKGLGMYIVPSGDIEDAYVMFNANQGGDVSLNGTSYSAPSIPGFANSMAGDPLFVQGPLGSYYLDHQTLSPAIDAAGDTASVAELDDYTTHVTGQLDTAQADLGYHYPIETREYMLTTVVVDADGLTAEGTLSPASGMQPRGKIIPLTADIGKEYFLVGWSGGTFSDTSQEAANTVLMSGIKDIKVIVRYRHTLNVGTSGDYDILADAINAAQDGDIILVAPGEYTAASQFPTATNTIALDGKKITISGSNPNDETVVRATIFRDIRFLINNVNKQTVFEGITLEQSRMLLLNADMVLRNCVFRECRFVGDYAFHSGTIPAGTDGYSQLPITGGALEMWDSSPRIFNCTFEDNSARGREGENGFGGAQSHRTGGDGGWPGGAYGGAVYCGFSSEPDFIECTFTGNEVFGAEGGNGANGWVDRGTVYNGGRGGGWVYDEVIEEYLKTALNDGWDGWANNAYGDKYGDYSLYSGVYGWINFYGAYDLAIWKKWFNWGDDYTSWEQFEVDYLNDPYDPLGDPYDQMVDEWRHCANGGAIFCESDSNATFTKCVFENNQAHGGLTGIGGYLVNDNSPWPDRRLNMMTMGGAVFAANDCDLVFTECQFRDNLADISTVELPHTFQVSFGGAVAYQYDCSVIFTNCDLSGNTATVGGSVYAFETDSQIIDCNVFENEAYIGAGIYSEDYNLTVKGTTFRSNQARTPAALPDPAESLDFTGMAGGLFAMVDTLNMRDSVFTENAANVSGGGLLLTGVVTSPSKVFNCLFADNLSGRDGAGASVNWSHQADFGNCTFANNAAQGLGVDAESFGGNLAVNYDCRVSVIDSILWGGSATKGRQFAVTSGYVDDARPSALSVSYSDIQGGRTSVAGHVEDGCLLEWISDTIITLDPLFVDATVGDYHLSQIVPANPESQTVDSPCLNIGSADASVLGLDHYTTATPVPQYDYGKVDLGYHYLFELSDNACRYADLRAAAAGKVGENRFFDGIVDTGDLYILAAWWLTETCDSTNLYCDGVDMSNADGVDFLDFVYLSSCWMDEDTEAPSQVQWNQEPTSGQGELFTSMSALEVTDNWGYVMYKFENMTDPSHTSRWRQNYDKNLNNADFEYVDIETSEPNVPWQWIDNNLLAQTYTYQIQVRDPRGNMTTTLLSKDVTVGLDYNPPLPNPAQWAVGGQPVQNGPTTVRMVAVPATDPEGNGVMYFFGCIENTALNSGWIASNEYVTPAAVALGVGQTYTFRVKYRDNSTNQNETESSTAVAVVISDQLDFNPPLATAPLLSGVRLQVDGQDYHILTATDLDGGVIEDPEGNGEEFQFVCDTTPALITNSVKVPWINVGNMLNGIRLFDVSWYPNGTAKVPYKIYIPIAGTQLQTYRVRVRDLSPAQNTTAWSVPIILQ